jgi:Mg2+-importing ATPase
VAAALAFVLRDFNDGLVIVVILIINTGLGFFQEFRSEKAVEKLQKLVDKDILVTRDGKQTLVPEKLLVPGDVVVLRQGDIVPADIRLFEVDDMTVNESQLSGESAPVTKTINGVNALIYAGGIIEGGEAKGIVYATSSSTELGKIAHLSSTTKRVTQFEKSLSSFSNFLVKVTFLTLLSVFILKLILVHDTSGIGTLLLFIIALSIAVVPEAMPVIVTVTLSRGALNLAKRHVIAKTLTAVEDLGNITVLCSDKTGTLTENIQTIKKLIAEDPKLFQRLAIASLESLDEKRKKFQSSFDKAFLEYIPQSIRDETAGYKRLEELPFDPSARRRRVVYSNGAKTFLVEVGSVETLLQLTKDPKAEQYQNTLQTDGAMGLRHLGIAYKEIHYINSESFDILKHEQDLEFVGFVALEDPLRPSAKHTIVLAEKLGVGIKVLSGDSREVTHYVATEVGLISPDQIVYTGEDIDAMSDDQLADVA